jgi:orotate phosphoribosyltransferase-like protein
MSKMSELAMEIRELHSQGFNEFTISTMLNVPVELVDNFVASFIEVSYNEDMDGDFDSAMASAGMGTNEDYGDYGEGL